MNQKIKILLASNDPDVIEIFDILVKEEGYNIFFYKNIETFLQGWMNGEFKIALLDLTLFNYYNINIVDFLKVNHSSLKVITIAPGENILEIEKKLLAAYIDPKILYRIIKPLSYDESKKIIDAALNYVGKIKDDSLPIKCTI